MTKVKAPSVIQGTAILDCTCKNEFQDKMYGKGKRVHNVLAKKSTFDYRCTACENCK